MDKEKIIANLANINMNKDIWLPTTNTLLIAFLAACQNGVNIPTISPEIGKTNEGGTEFGLLPTPNKETLNKGVYQTESYCSKDLALCAFHQFDKDGNALAPRAFSNAAINFDLDNNTIVITGDPLIHADSEVAIYPEENGQKGYETLQVMSIESMTEWSKNMSVENMAKAQIIIEEAKSNNVDIRILMKTVLNIQKDQDGNDRLVDMSVGVALNGGGDESSIMYLEGLASPISNEDLLKNQQIAAVDFVPQFSGTENLVMKVYPSDWIEIGNGEYVSPEFIVIQDQIAASGEKFTLMPNGVIQEKTDDGTKDITGLLIDKRGQRIITVNGEVIVIDSADLTVNDQDGIKINGYTFDTQTGLWSLAESPLPQGPISELQKTLGENYKLTKAKEGDYFVINGIDNLKFNQDGTAQLVYSGEDLTIAFQAISVDGEKLNIGPWQYNKEGEVTMLTAGAPKSVEDAANFPKLAYLEGHAKEKEIDLTIHKYVQMATAETAASEFEEVFEGGERIDMRVPTIWQTRKTTYEGIKGIALEDSESYNKLIALKSGYTNLAVFDVDGQQKMKLKIVPILVRDIDGSISPIVALTEETYFSNLLEYLSIEKRTGPAANLVTSASGEDGVSVWASNELQEFLVQQNQELIAKDVLKGDLFELPQILNEEGFWCLGY